MDVIEAKARQHEQGYSDRDRKKLGAHYTPDAVIDYIVRRVLRPLSDDPARLRSVRILDPACGSGLFLLKAYEILADCWQRANGSLDEKDARRILKDCLFGIDIDKRAVSATRAHLLQKACLDESDSALLDTNVVVGDALSLAHPTALIPIHNHTADELPPGGVFAKHSFDCIIGNPPYVRIQNTPAEKRGCYTSSYATAAGRFDISALFIELSEYLLKDNGRLGFIVSNKVLSTAGAKGLRRFLLAQFDLEEIVDLADTKLFAAAVLPLIVIASRPAKNGNRTRPPNQIAYSSIVESHDKTAIARATDNILHLLDNSEIPSEADVSFANRVFKLQRFYTDVPSSKYKVWTFHNEGENRILSKMRHNSACTLSHIAKKISVGLKTTADDIFIKPMTEDFIEREGLEAALVHPVLESHNIGRWTYNWNGRRDLFVLYPHIKEYLEANRARLGSRTYLIKGGRRWYEIWVHQSPSDFARKKIITPDISLGNRFALDEKGFYVNGTCFYLILGDESDASYYSILGLLNSKVIEYFHKVTSGNSLYAKRFRYWSSYIGAYPVPKRLLQFPAARLLIAQNVGKLLAADGDDDRLKLEEENDRLCYELFDLTEDEIREIGATLSTRSQPLSKKGNVGR